MPEKLPQQGLQAPPFLGEAVESAQALVARQPIFDLRGRVWGYELLFRDPSLQPGLGNKSSEAATSTVMIDGFELMRPMLCAKQRFLINFTAEFLKTGLPSVLPSDICVIEILENVEPTDTVLQGLQKLKSQGYMLALDDYVGQKELAPFLPLVHIVKVDVLGMEADAVRDIAKSLKTYPVKLLAEKVEDGKMASLCRGFGFSLFQGFFYSKAEIVWGKKLNPSQISKTRLLALTAQEFPDMQQIVQAISADVYLTYKLLKYINSLFFGLTTQVRNVAHAIALLGVQKVRQWLCVTALADMDATPMSQEIVRISAFRAKFLELLAETLTQRTRQNKELSSKLFITGLFSLLESLLKVPLKEIFNSLALDEEVLQALDDGSGPLGLWYKLMESYEQGQWRKVRECSQRLSLTDRDLVSAYVEAENWTSVIFSAGSCHEGSKNRSLRTAPAASSA